VEGAYSMRKNKEVKVNPSFINFGSRLKEAIYSIDSRTAPVKMHILAYQINNSNLKVTFSRNDSNTFTLTLPAGDSFINRDINVFNNQNVVKVLDIDKSHIDFAIPALNSTSKEDLFLYYDNDEMQDVR
jgi:hypothetical protein